jgi:hypothetical protein
VLAHHLQDLGDFVEIHQEYLRFTNRRIDELQLVRRSAHSIGQPNPSIRKSVNP